MKYIGGIAVFFREYGWEGLGAIALGFVALVIVLLIASGVFGACAWLLRTERSAWLALLGALLAATLAASAGLLALMLLDLTRSGERIIAAGIVAGLLGFGLGSTGRRDSVTLGAIAVVLTWMVPLVLLLDVGVASLMSFAAVAIAGVIAGGLLGLRESA